MTSNSSHDDATPCADLPLAQRVEALLLSADRPLSVGRMATVLGIEGDDTAPIEGAIAALNEVFDGEGRAVRIERLAGGFRVMTRPELAPLVSRLHAERAQHRLSQAALETLSIVAYRQPVMRAELEAIRGVACGEVLRTLMDRRLVKITGRAEELGRPMLYGTTRNFLNVFGLATLDDLPAVEGLVRQASYRPAAPVAASDPSDAPDAAESKAAPEPEAAPDPSEAVEATDETAEA